MAVRSLQYLTLDMIERIAAVPGRDRTNSRSQSVLRYRGCQLDSATSPFTPVGHCRAARHRGGADGDGWLIGIAAIAASFIQPSRGVGVHSKQSHSPWRRCSSRYLRPR
jgi:hypothetical protein